MLRAMLGYPTTESPAYYLAKAEEWDERAAQARDERERRKARMVAESYRDLADGVIAHRART
jgi:hypothetical protein